jgi:hypothetical protein
LCDLVTDAFALTVRTAREYCALPEPDESALLLGPLVRRGERTIIVGDPGHGKTSLALQFLAGVVRGDDVFGFLGAGAGPALYIDLEQGVRSIKRCLRETQFMDSDDVLVVSVPDGLALDADAEHYAELCRVIGEHRPTVVLLDPFYKAHRADDPNAERPVIDLMRKLDALRTERGFALLMPAHPRKDVPGSKGHRKLTLHDVAGSGAVTRGAEVVLAIERLEHGAARLRVLKDRDGDLQVGDAWPLLFDREHGFIRAADKPPRDLEAECEAWLIMHPGSTTNKVAAAVQAGRDSVSRTLKESTRFQMERGPNRAHHWSVASDVQTHLGHLDAPRAAVGGPVGGPSLEGPTEATRALGGPSARDDRRPDDDPA